MFGIEKKVTQHLVILGLNDKITKVQKLSTVEAYKVASGIVARYYDGFTIREAHGCYKYEDGSVEFEESLEIIILVFDKHNDDISGLTEELKKVFNQESIALQTSKVTSRLV